MDQIIAHQLVLQDRSSSSVLAHEVHTNEDDMFSQPVLSFEQNTEADDSPFISEVP